MKEIKRSISLLSFEMVIISNIISLVIIVPFWNSIGMNQWMIGVSQSAFSLSMIILNLVTGWIADKFSRKWSNILGCLLTAILFILYSQVTNFWQVLLLEILIGATTSLCNGADTGLLITYCKKLDASDNTFKKVSATISIFKPIILIAFTIIGSLIGSVNYRLAIAADSIPFFIGFIVCLFVVDEKSNFISKHSNPIKDIWHYSCKTLTLSKELRWKIVAYIFTEKITHVTLWVFTPILILTGIPMYIVGIGWTINSIFCLIGASVASRYQKRIGIHYKIAIPALFILIGLSIMSIQLNIVTVWLYCTLGFARGWYCATILPEVQTSIPHDMQSIAVSVTKTLAQILYAVLLPIISSFGSIDIKYSLISTLIIFIPFILLSAQKLHKFE